MYMHVANTTVAQQISQSIQALSDSGQADRVTRFALSWQETPDGKTWLHWAFDGPIPVRAEKLGVLAQLMGSFVAAGKITQASADAVMAQIVARLQQSGDLAQLTLTEVTPPEWEVFMISDKAWAALYPPPDIKSAPVVTPQNGTSTPWDEGQQ